MCVAIFPRKRYTFRARWWFLGWRNVICFFVPPGCFEALFPSGQVGVLFCFVFFLLWREVRKVAWCRAPLWVTAVFTFAFLFLAARCWFYRWHASLFLFVSQLPGRKDVVSVCCYQLLQFDPRPVHSLLLHVWPPHPSLYFERDEPYDLFAHPGAHGGKKIDEALKCT